VRAVESKLSPPSLPTDSPSAGVLKRFQNAIPPQPFVSTQLAAPDVRSGCRRRAAVEGGVPTGRAASCGGTSCGAIWMPEADSSSGVNDRRTGSQPPAGDPAFS